MNEQGSLGSMVDKVMVSILISTNDCSKLIDGAINSKCVLSAKDRGSTQGDIKIEIAL